MHFATSFIAIGSLIGLATAVSQPGFQFPDLVPVAKRQTSGPAYECHANCGYAIEDSAKDGYCKDPAWKKLLDGCLDCALTYKIWQYYGDKVGAAAKKCGLDATPKPADGGVGSSVAGSATAAPTNTAPATTAADQSSAPPAEHTGHSSAASEVVTSSPAEHTGAQSTHAVPTGSAAVTPGGHNNSTASGSPTSPVTSGASQMIQPGAFVAGIAVLVAAGLC